MSDRPNILLVLADELRADVLGCYGSPVPATPALDRLAAEGARFADCVVTQPTCTPSRASILTGAYPSALKSRMVGCFTPDDPRFLGYQLGASGYHTLSIGKIHLVPQRAEPERAHNALDGGGDRASYFGFDEVDLVNGHGDGCFGPHYEGHVAASGVELVTEPGAKDGPRPFPFRLPAELHSSAYIADRTVDFLRSRGSERPFFAHVSFNDPHHPFTVPEPWASQYSDAALPEPIPHAATDMPEWYETIYRRRYPSLDPPVDRVTGTPPHDYAALDADDWRAMRATYHGMTACLDHHLGRILAALEDTGLAERTIVVFVADHGDYMGDHGFLGKGLPFDGALRVPLIVRGPGVAPGTAVEDPASTLDIAPTLLDIVGIDAPEGVQGLSVAAALAGGAYPRTAALTENDDDMYPMRARTLTTREWRLTRWAASDDGLLFDRLEDPQELRNRYHDPAVADVRRRLEQQLFDEVLCSIDYANGRRQKPAPAARRWVPTHNCGV